MTAALATLQSAVPRQSRPHQYQPGQGSVEAAVAKANLPPELPGRL